MIITTNENNPLTLKLLISAAFSKKATELKSVQTNDDVSVLRLPCLILDDGAEIFSSNSAACYLFGQFPEDTVWLEWEATNLLPVLVSKYCSNKNNTAVDLQVQELLKYLNGALQNTYLCGDSITINDICIFSTLSGDNLMQAFQGLSALTRWYNNMQSLPEVQSSLKSLPLKSLSYKNVKNASPIWFPSQTRDIFRTESVTSCKTPVSMSDHVTPDEIQLAKDCWKPVGRKLKQSPRTILPVAGEKNILITSALPYVNNVPHLGNIIGCVLSADIFARYARLCNYNTLYISGTDEYGTATETKALAEGLTPKQICDKYFEIHNSIYRWFGIGFDYFGRTTTKEQTEIVQDIFLKLNDRKMIKTQVVEQLLCQNCDRYLADRFVEGTCPHIGCGYEDARGDQCDGCGKLVNAIELIKPRCKVCGKAPVVRESSQFFLRLSEIEGKLKEWVEETSSEWTNNARVITKSWLKEGLKDRCITRDLKWGIPVPLKNYEDKVFYVWFDAPIGYMSITSRYTKEWRQWWQPKENTSVTLYQFMAKDNVPFHSVMFPATLFGLNEGYTIVSHIMATEYLNYEDGKFSKSRGIGVFGNDAQDTGIPSDIWRFYLASARPEGQDSSFSWSDLVTRNNSELLNNLGNFVNRALMFAENNFGAEIPHMVLNEEDYALLALCNRDFKAYVACMQKAKMRDGIRHMLSISRHGNQYMQSQKPWVLLKGTENEKLRASTVVGICCNLSYLLAILLHPFMPETSRNLLQQLNLPLGCINPDEPVLTIMLPSGHKLGKVVPLFSKIDPSSAEQLKAKYGGNQVNNTTKNLNQCLITKEELENAIQKQADKVRSLKSSGVEKSVWQPEVSTLLNLKKQLKTLNTAPSNTQSVPSGNAGTKEQLETAVQKQADKVRVLKSSGVEKAVWQPEVNILLGLKKQLEKFNKSAPSPVKTEANSLHSGIFKSKIDLEAAVQKQGDKVRNLKASGVEKTAWQPEVKILLDLKKQLETFNSTTNNIEQKSNTAQLEEAIKNQGDKVRSIKASGGAKSVVQPEINTLLDLKKRLSQLLTK